VEESGQLSLLGSSGLVSRGPGIGSADPAYPGVRAAARGPARPHARPNAPRADRDRACSAGHHGLDIMRERAEEIGAVLEIERRSGSGTQVAVTWS